MSVPTRRVRVINPDDAMTEIRVFLERLTADGERPWCEVWYPRPSHFDGTDEQWDELQAGTFDAVELVDGVIVTLPPYTEGVS